MGSYFGAQLPWDFSHPQPAPPLYGPYKMLKYLLGPPIMVRGGSIEEPGGPPVFAGLPNPIIASRLTGPPVLLPSGAPVQLEGLGPSPAIPFGSLIQASRLSPNPLVGVGSPPRTTSPGPLFMTGNVSSTSGPSAFITGGAPIGPSSPTPIIGGGGTIRGSGPFAFGTPATGGNPIFTVAPFKPSPFATPTGPTLTTRTLKYSQSPWGISNTASPTGRAGPSGRASPTGRKK